jgi:hypothetical protein
MADAKVSALTALAVTPADADEFYINDGGVSKKITYGTLKADFATAASAHAAVTVTDSTSIDFALTGQAITAAAIFGSTAGTVCEGNDSRVANAAQRPGVTGGQTLIGGTAVDDKLTVQGTTGNGTATAAAFEVKTGNNGALTALAVLNNGTVNLGGNLDLNGQKITGSAGTVTTSQPIIDVAQTWNDAAVEFTAIKANVTNTTSAAGSNLLGLQVNSSDVFTVRREGSLKLATPGGSVDNFSVTAAGVNITHRFAYASNSSGGTCVLIGYLSGSYPNGGIAIRTGGVLAFNTNPDLTIYRDAADTLAQRRTTSPQTYRLYNTFTDASNYERLSFNWNSNVAEILPEAAGTGTLRDLKVGASGGKLGLLGATPVARQAHVDDADTAHALDETFSDTEVESALNALATKLNAVLKTLEDFGLHATS